MTTTYRNHGSHIHMVGYGCSLVQLLRLEAAMATSMMMKQKSPAQGHHSYSRSRISCCHSSNYYYYFCCQLPQHLLPPQQPTATITSELSLLPPATAILADNAIAMIATSSTTNTEFSYDCCNHLSHY